jgi:hypothetical protein
VRQRNSETEDREKEKQGNRAAGKQSSREAGTEEEISAGHLRTKN